MTDELLKQERKELKELEEEHRKALGSRRQYIRKIQIAQREIVFINIFNNWLSFHVRELDSKAKVYLNTSQLRLALKGYWKDIDRIKDLHNIDYANEPKKAAFTVKWIMKRSPISYDPNTVENPTAEWFLGLVNEHFALMCAFHFTRIDDELLSDDLMDELLYALHYREIKADALMLWFDTYYIIHGLDRVNGKDKES